MLISLPHNYKTTNRLKTAITYFAVLLCAIWSLPMTAKINFQKCLVMPKGLTDQLIPSVSTSLAIFFTSPCNTLPGPTSVNFVAPFSTIF